MASMMKSCYPFKGVGRIGMYTACMDYPGIGFISESLSIGPLLPLNGLHRSHQLPVDIGESHPV